MGLYRTTSDGYQQSDLIFVTIALLKRNPLLSRVSFQVGFARNLMYVIAAPLISRLAD